MIRRFLFTLALSLNLLRCLFGNQFRWYRKTFEDNDDDWIDLRGTNYTSLNVKSEVLSSKYLSFSRRNLTFEFPFYGEKISSVSVTTQGFISLISEPYLRLYETQYISPLMANFAPKLADPTQDVRIHQDDETMIVQWSTMLLAEEDASHGYFTFQTQLLRDGTIKFIYKQIPARVSAITDMTHPVVSGLSGAYRYTKHDNTPVYEAFDTMSVSKNKITSHTTYTFHPLPACTEESSCKKCRQLSPHCHWCPTIQRCSTGTDSLKPIWDANSCRLLSKSECEEDLPYIPSFSPTSNPTTTNSSIGHIPDTSGDSDEDEKVADHSGASNDMLVIKALLISTSAIVVLLILATVLVRRYGWRHTVLMSHVKLETKGCDCSEEVNHTLIKVEDSST